jgi:hypothetical protein
MTTKVYRERIYQKTEHRSHPFEKKYGYQSERLERYDQSYRVTPAGLQTPVA